MKQFKKNGAKVIEGLEPSKIIAQGINKNANIIICSNYSERIIYKSLKIFRDKGMETYNLYNWNKMKKYFNNPSLNKKIFLKKI